MRREGNYKKQSRKREEIETGEIETEDSVDVQLVRRR